MPESPKEQDGIEAALQRMEAEFNYWKAEYLEFEFDPGSPLEQARLESDNDVRWRTIAALQRTTHLIQGKGGGDRARQLQDSADLVRGEIIDKDVQARDADLRALTQDFKKRYPGRQRVRMVDLRSLTGNEETRVRFAQMLVFHLNSQFKESHKQCGGETMYKLQAVAYRVFLKGEGRVPHP